MYPVLAKVKFESLGRFQGRRELFGLSMTLNWVIGPLLMFALAWIFLPDEPAYRNGLILIGLARCIAMVLIWNSLACGDGDVAAVLVAFNSVFQIVMYSVLGWLFLTEIPGWFGAETATLDISMWEIAKNVLIFLGIPLLAAIVLRIVLVRRKGDGWYENRYLPKIGPTALLGLLYTIVIMFAMQGDHLLNNPFDVLRIALPLVDLLRGDVLRGVLQCPPHRLRLRGNRRRCPSPPRATTSSSRSRSRSASSGSPRARRWRESSVR